MAALALQYAPLGTRPLQERHIPKVPLQRNIPVQPTETAERPDSAEQSDLQTSLGMSESDKASADRRVQSLEKAMAYMRKQHRELVVGLQQEVEMLKEENRDLKLQLILLQENGSTKPDVDSAANKGRQGSASGRKLRAKSVTFPETNKDSPRSVLQRPAGAGHSKQSSKVAADYDDVVLLDSTSSVDESDFSAVSERQVTDAGDTFQVPSNGQFYSIQHVEHGTCEIYVKTEEQASWRGANLNDCKQCIEYLHSLILKMQQLVEEGNVGRQVEETGTKGSTATASTKQLNRPKVKPSVTGSLFMVNGRGMNPLATETGDIESDRPPSAPLRSGNKSSLPPLVQKVGNRGVQMMKKVKSRQLENELNFRLQNLTDK